MWVIFLSLCLSSGESSLLEAQDLELFGHRLEGAGAGGHLHQRLALAIHEAEQARSQAPEDSGELELRGLSLAEMAWIQAYLSRTCNGCAAGMPPPRSWRCSSGKDARRMRQRLSKQRTARPAIPPSCSAPAAAVRYG